MRFNAWQDSLQYCVLGKKVCAKKVNVHASRKTNNILNNIMKKYSISHIVLNYIIHYAIPKQFLKNQKDAVRLYGDFWTQILEESNMLFAHFLCFADGSFSPPYCTCHLSQSCWDIDYSGNQVEKWHCLSSKWGGGMHHGLGYTKILSSTTAFEQ